MKKLIVLLIAVIIFDIASAQDKIFLKATGKIDCRIQTINYVEGKIFYLYDNLGQSESRMIEISKISGVYMSKDDEYYRPDDNGELQIHHKAMYMQPVQKNWIGIAATLRAMPILSGGVEASYTRFFNQKTGAGLSITANKLNRKLEDFKVNAAQVYIFPHFTQHFYNYTTSSTLYYSIGYGVSYQGGDLYKKVVVKDAIHGIHEEIYESNDYKWTMGQFALTLGCEVYVGKEHRNALDFSLKLITAETIKAATPTTIRQKLGYPQFVDGLYLSVGWRFGL